ncbi:MAG: PEP-CTERM sorting domain-containing protein [Pseudomonadota bacterium]
MTLSTTALRGLLASTLLATSVAANAGLVIDITGDSGSGQTLWTFSGSTHAGGSAFFDDHDNLNNNDTWQDLLNFTAEGDLEVTSVTGDAALTIDGQTRNIDLAYVDNDGSDTDQDDFGVGVDGSSNFNFYDGDLVSWSGALSVDLDIDMISLAGTPVTLTADRFGSNALLALTINIGYSHIGVPEPGTIPLVLLGLGGLAYARRRIAR